MNYNSEKYSQIAKISHVIFLIKFELNSINQISSQSS